MNELADIQRRLERLERANRRWKAVVLAAPLAAFIAFVIGAQKGQAQQIIQPGKPQSQRDSVDERAAPILASVAARRIVLYDKTDKPALVLTPESIVLQQSEDGRELTRMDRDGFLLLDGRTGIRASLTTDKGGSYLYLRDARNRRRS